MLSPSQMTSPLAPFLAVAVCLGLLPATAPAISYLPTQMADGFDFPVGKPDADGYYRFRGFRINYHLGDDWNGIGGGDSDRGKPVYAVAHGVVVYSEDYRSNWGNVVIIRHAYREKGQICYVDSLYGHLDKRFVNLYDPIRKGQKVGTIGTNHGMYTAHLHFEIRKDINIGLVSRRYAMDYSTYYNPQTFIDRHRFFPFEYELHPVPVDCFHSDVKSRFTGDRLAQLPEDPLSKPKPPARVDPLVREVLQNNGLVPPPPKDTPAKDAEEAKERAKIRKYWSTTKSQIEQADDALHREAHGDHDHAEPGDAKP